MFIRKRTVIFNAKVQRVEGAKLISKGKFVVATPLYKFLNKFIFRVQHVDPLRSFGIFSGKVGHFSQKYFVSFMMNFVISSYKRAINNEA